MNSDVIELLDKAIDILSTQDNPECSYETALEDNNGVTPIHPGSLKPITFYHLISDYSTEIEQLRALVLAFYDSCPNSDCLDDLLAGFPGWKAATNDIIATVSSHYDVFLQPRRRGNPQ